MTCLQIEDEARRWEDVMDGHRVCILDANDELLEYGMKSWVSVDWEQARFCPLPFGYPKRLEADCLVWVVVPDADENCWRKLERV